MIKTLRTRLHDWLNPAKEQERLTRARQITIAIVAAVLVVALAIFALYAGVLVGLFVDGYRLAT